MKKSLDPKTVTRRSFLRVITGVSATASGILLGLISPARTWAGQQEGTDSSDRAATESDSDSSDRSGRSGSDSNSSDQTEESDSSDRSASDSDSDSGDSSGR